jgi:hypothetical protein
LRVDWSIKIGDLLTMATIVVSVTALLISWSKDRDSRQKEQANQVRVAVGTAVAKLDRLQALHLSAFQELQPVFVDTGEMLTRDFNVVAARDFLVKSINGQRTKIVGKALDEHIETAYIGLFSHFPAIRPLFLDTLRQLKGAEEEVLGAFLDATQREVMALRQRKADYSSAELERTLRGLAAEHRADLELKTNRILEPVRAFLLQVVTKSDSEILTHGIAPATGKP